MRGTIGGIRAALIKDGLFLHQAGFDAAPFAPEQTVRSAEREKSKRLGSRRRCFPGRGQHVRCRVRVGERREADRIVGAGAATVMPGQNVIDAEEFRRCGLLSARCSVCTGCFARCRVRSRYVGCGANTERDNEHCGPRMRARLPQIYGRRHDVLFVRSVSQRLCVDRPPQPVIGDETAACAA